MAHNPTPGPYALGTYGNNRFCIEGGDRILAIVETKITQLADGIKLKDHEREPDGEDWANGFLFTAAPDLLEACKLVLGAGSEDERLAAMERVKEAVDKATCEIDLSPKPEVQILTEEGKQRAAATRKLMAEMEARQRL